MFSFFFNSNLKGAVFAYLSVGCLWLKYSTVILIIGKKFYTKRISENNCWHVRNSSLIKTQYFFIKIFAIKLIKNRHGEKRVRNLAIINRPLLYQAKRLKN